MMESNLKRLQVLVAKENLDCFLVSEMTDIRYLTGFSGTSAKLLVFPKKSYFLTDFRYREQARKQVKGAQVVVGQRDPIRDFPDFAPLKGKNIKIGFSKPNLSYGVVETLKQLLPWAVFLPIENLVGTLSIVKNQYELDCIKKAVKISDIAFARILGFIRPGLRELEIAAELEYQMKILGSEKSGFDTIIASGVRSSMPHGVASGKVIRKGEFITLDFGAIYNGYHSDITRTVVVGKATPRQKKIYHIVLEAQKAAIRAARAGMFGKALDAVARKIINKAGFGKYFGHGLGHGLGVVIHDNPAVAPQSEVVLKPNMVVTIEPGVYIPQWGGVRIEDDIIIRKNGCIVLNKAEKRLIEL